MPVVLELLISTTRKIFPRVTFVIAVDPPFVPVSMTTGAFAPIGPL
jgi:hypothetical protein